MSDPETTIEATKHGIAWTDPDGARHEYEQPIRTLWLKLVNLRQTYAARYREAGNEYEPLLRGFKGTAVFPDRSSLEVIGKPDTRSTSLSASIVELDEKRLNSKEARGFKPVSLSYAKHDWEIGNDETWWLEVYLPPVQFNTLATVFQSDKLAELELGLEMQGLYIEEWGAPPSVSVNWRLPPLLNQISKLATGDLKQLRIETRALDLSPKSGESGSNGETDTRYAAKPVENISTALRSLSSKVDNLDRHTKWIFWALVAMIGVYVYVATV
jgi:hypothetical protein